VGPEKGNEKEGLHLKTGLELSTLIEIQEEESDKKYVRRTALQYSSIIVVFVVFIVVLLYYCERKY